MAETRTKRERHIRKRILEELTEGTGIKESILAQSTLSGEEFIGWVTEKFLAGEAGRERPSIEEIHRHRSNDGVMRVITRETGKNLEAIKTEKGVLRQITMGLLYRIGGLKGQGIGRLMDVGYTSVSQERRRLHARMMSDKKIKAMVDRLSAKCNE
jgi:hypothetical protein